MIDDHNEIVIILVQKILFDEIIHVIIIEMTINDLSNSLIIIIAK